MKKILLLVFILNASLFTENLQPQAKTDTTKTETETKKETTGTANKQVQTETDKTNKQPQAKDDTTKTKTETETKKETTGTAKQGKSKDKSKTLNTTETDTTIKKEELNRLKETERELGRLTNEKNKPQLKADSLKKATRLTENPNDFFGWKNNWLPLLIGFSCGLGLIMLAFLGWKKWSEEKKENDKSKDPSQKPAKEQFSNPVTEEKNKYFLEEKSKETRGELSDLERKINELTRVLQTENSKQTAELTRVLQTENSKQTAELTRVSTELSKRFLSLEGKILVVSDLAEDLKIELENLPSQQKITLTDTQKNHLRESKRKLERLNSELKKLDVDFTVNQNEWKRQRREKVESLLKATDQLLEEPSQNTLVRLLSYLKNPEENDFSVEELLEKTTDRNLRDTLISLASYLDRGGIFENEIFNSLVREFGAEVIYPEQNASFNPQTMDVSGTRTVQGIAVNCVVSVERRGFRVGNEVVQKARVVLAN